MDRTVYVAEAGVIILCARYLPGEARIGGLGAGNAEDQF